MRILLALFLLLAAPPARAEIIKRLPTADKVVALTFDACESVSPTILDRGIADYLAAERIPHTVFVSGRFARSHPDEVAELARSGLAEIENHSFNHPQHMERLAPEQVAREVAETQAILAGLTGKPSRFFRFPAGNYDQRTLEQVEAMGLRVVHWEEPSGDPSRDATADRLLRHVLANTRPGAIHIFHINGRGWHTAAMLPRLVEELRRRGYRFVRLDEAL